MGYLGCAMETDLYDFDFDEAHVAQRPAARREDARLLVLDRRRGQRTLHHFRDLPALVRGDELLVVNDTRVLPARLRALRPTGGRVELLLVAPVPEHAGRWTALGRANKPLRPGAVVHVGDERLQIVERADDGTLTLEHRPGLDIPGLLALQGELPLPPYIRRTPGPHDAQRYQTVFAAQPGAVAAPTAALHFSEQLVAELRRRGVELATVTLHVGPGTFRPMAPGRVADHRMHTERYSIPEATVHAIQRARQAGRPVVAVGTTVVRTLEAAALRVAAPGPPAAAPQRPPLPAGPCSTDLFIRPGFAFRAVDSLITNFHWPRSTLLVLVAALAGRTTVLEAYAHAIEQGLRLFSYGDSMWIR